MISSLVVEKLEQHCVQGRNKSDICEQFEQHMRSDQFITGMVRLFEHYYKTEDLTKVEQKVREKLKSIEIYLVKDIRTFLEYEGKQMAKSCKEYNTFADQQNEHCIIYITNKLPGKHHLINNIFKTINYMFDRKPNTFSLELLTILRVSKYEIEDELNAHGIKCNREKTQENDGPLPKLGTPVPIEHHHFLEECIVLLQADEYVGYEFYDPLEDLESIDKNGDPIIYYAQVVNAVTNPETNIPFANYRYIIKTGKKDTIEVHASQLYRFVRKDSTCFDLLPSNQTSSEATNAESKKYIDMDKEKKEITQYLENALSQEEHVKKRLIKRLFLKWHPDKNPDNIEKSTQLFQFIQNELKRLTSGSNYETPSSNYSQWFRDFQDYEYCYNFFRQRAKRHNDFDRSYKANIGNSRRRSRRGWHRQGTHHGTSMFVPPMETQNNSNPQKQEARRWIRQAEHDMRTASENTSYEWGAYIYCQVIFVFMNYIFIPTRIYSVISQNKLLLKGHRNYYHIRASC
jgi:sacsin